MQKDLLLDLIAQNQLTCWAVFNQITPANAALRLTKQAASVGFMFRHVGETLNRFGAFLGQASPVENTTMGQSDHGQGQDVPASRVLVEDGFAMLRRCVESTPEATWSESVQTPFFGPVSRGRLFAHMLFHNSYHAGQVALTIKRGEMMLGS